ncbi:ABC transporter ATP-binding protein [Catellatospora sp. KI3]|uniref:ABC transporter ATP-binding protein n=1 Tax=Catellatospora sp. KI3 TaxID=3041620 RepID=UPI00248231C9|nr:ABC transporter ATP-binding protein [Catellatospora sp. KI3]MDI1462248.1 ABC transporter ATP-binding protein [Catellatospora sp. KI3]
MTVLDVRAIRKAFGAVQAVDGVSLRVEPGEIVGLLGPNGAGKSTTLHMVLGLISPDSGTVRLFGRDPARNRTEVLSRINFAAGYLGLPGSLRVWEVLRSFAFSYGVARPAARVDEVIELLDLGRLRNQRFRELSSGQQTRVQLAKALINEPELLVLDEPTASLDPDVGDRMRELLLAQARESGRAMLITSHNMREVERMCHRIHFIAEGRIVAEGNAEQLAGAYGVADLEEVFLKVARQ